MPARQERRSLERQRAITSWNFNTIMMFSGFLSFLLFIFRLVDALSIKTFFQPDEYYQSLEPAWDAAFGQSGKAWITWEWREHIRSSMHPTLFAQIYKAAHRFCAICRLSSNSRTWILMVSPKLLQAYSASNTDLYTWLLACKIFGFNTFASWVTLILTVVSPWQWFASVRTLSNSMETTLTIMALYAWPWDWILSWGEEQGPQAVNTAQEATGATSFFKLMVPESLRWSLVLASVAVIMRPTNILVWATIVLTLLWRHYDTRKALTIVENAFVVGTAVLAISIGLDRSFYGSWVFPPLHFLYHNVVQSVAIFYGINRPDFYFTEALLLLLTTAIPLAVLGMWVALHPNRGLPPQRFDKESEILFALAMAVVVSIVALTFFSHKEVRFIYPLLPMLHVLAGKAASVYCRRLFLIRKKWVALVLWGTLGLNVYIAYYGSRVHQRGVIDVVHYLRHEYQNKVSDRTESAAPPNMTVGFLMPCHSTPWRSHMVYPEINAWALTCEPPLNLTKEERAMYLDEADMFYASPEAWIEHNMKDRGTVMRVTDVGNVDLTHGDDKRDWPQYLVFFRQLEPTLQSILEDSKYVECWRGFNTHWHDDWRRKGDVVVWCIPSSPIDSS